jgi:hypothetical protein
LPLEAIHGFVCKIFCSIQIFVRFDIRIPLHFCNFEKLEEKLKSLCEIEHFRFEYAAATYSLDGQEQGG